MGSVAMMDARFWRDRSVFVTGATGMLGSWLVKRLILLDARVVILLRDADPQSELIRSGDISRTRVVNGALENYDTLQRALIEAEIQTVFHLGAQALVGAALRDPRSTFESNIRGTYNLLECCRINSDRIEEVVVASSDKAYGQSETLPYTEEMPLLGRHPYDTSKACADMLAQSYSFTYGLPVSVARCGNTYGGGDLNWSRIVPGTIRDLLAGRPPVIRSDGKFVRDYIYTEDVVDAYLVLAQSVRSKELKGHAFNFSTESPVPVTEMVGAIQRLLNRADLKPHILNSAKGEIRNQSLSSAKAKKVLGWRAQHNLEQGLSKTIAWYKTFLGVEH